MGREFYSKFEPSPYSYELFDAYYDVLTEGYLGLNADINSTNMETMKAILILFITFPRKALQIKGTYDILEAKIKAVTREEELQACMIDIFQALSDINLHIDLYKQTFMNENQSNTKVVLMLKKISQNILNGYEKTARRLMFMFYLAFRHDLKSKCDDIFLSREPRSIYEINKTVMSKADEVGMFIKSVTMVSGLYTK